MFYFQLAGAVWLKWMTYIYIHGLMGAVLLANLSQIWTINAVINMCGKELEQLDGAKGRMKTLFTILGLAQILVYVSTFSTMLLGGHCEPDVATIPYAMTIMMGL